MIPEGVGDHEDIPYCFDSFWSHFSVALFALSAYTYSSLSAHSSGIILPTCREGFSGALGPIYTYNVTYFKLSPAAGFPEDRHVMISM